MKIEGYGAFIEGYRAFIDFELTRGKIPNDPSLEFSIKVENKAFKGEVQQVFFWLKDLEDFVSQLEAVEKSRQGKATLKEMSHISEHRSFWMEIFSVDKVGQFCISIEIQKIGYVGSNSKLFIQNKLFATLEIDPSSLPNILADFKAYLS